MNTDELKALQVELSRQLKNESITIEKAKQVQSLYDEKLALFHAENQDLVDSLKFANDDKVLYKQAVVKLKAEATKELGTVFIDDLPEGFVQVD